MMTPKQGIPRSVLMRGSAQHATPTQPSLPRNPPRSTGPQGTPGGRKRSRGAQTMVAGDEMYLWGLVALEVLFIGGMRKLFKRYHGG